MAKPDGDPAAGVAAPQLLKARKKAKIALKAIIMVIAIAGGGG